MTTCRFGVVVFPGSNCDRDVVWVTRGLLGCPTQLIWHGSPQFDPVDVLVLAGGFSYGDYLRCGAIARFAPVMRGVQEHVARGGYVLGICNGFQVLLEADLLPGALIRNVNLQFLCERVQLRVERNDTPWTRSYGEQALLTLPIAHGEGCYTCDGETLARLQAQDQILFRYWPTAPNGSLDRIAGICDPTQRILGLMPHPERVADPHLHAGAAPHHQDGLPLWRGLAALASIPALA